MDWQWLIAVSIVAASAITLSLRLLAWLRGVPSSCSGCANAVCHAEKNAGASMLTQIRLPFKASADKEPVGPS
jgi:hypothetical protein